MGASLKTGGGGGGAGAVAAAAHAPMSEINVTPFVDVMLVLLIIFMVAAPLLTAGVPLDLPQPRAGRSRPSRRSRWSSSITKDGKIYVGQEEKNDLTLEELVPRLKAIFEARGDQGRGDLPAGRHAGPARRRHPGSGAHQGVRLPESLDRDRERAGRLIGGARQPAISLCCMAACSPGP